MLAKSHSLKVLGAKSSPKLIHCQIQHMTFTALRQMMFSRPCCSTKRVRATFDKVSELDRKGDFATGKASHYICTITDIHIYRCIVGKFQNFDLELKSILYFAKDYLCLQEQDV